MEKNLSIYHCLNNTQWEELTGTRGSDVNGNYVLVTGVTAFSPFAIGNPGLPLAVNVEYFTAQRAENAVQLDWQTVSEIDNAGFNLYRAVDDGSGTPAPEDWLRLNDSLIPSQAPGSSGGYAYEWLDATAAANVGYLYRMDAVDLHGSVKTVATASVASEVRRIWLPLIWR